MPALLQERTYKVLLVEDEAVNIGIILDCLASLYQMFIAKTRKKALEILLKEDIDLILLDINLPDGNGFDICKEVINDSHTYGSASIVFMTGLDSPEHEARGIELGARDYITKPINNTVLRARVELQIQLLRQTELLSKLARIDGLTEINNRRAFDDQLAIEWGRAMREGEPVSLCLLDIDFFKQYNDTYGHPAGDQCLKNLSKCLSRYFKRSTDFVARYGGEEFAIIIYKADSKRANELVNDALKTFIDLKIPHSGSTVSKFVSFSAGICSGIPTKSSSVDALLEKTDQALYHAKNSGRAQVSQTTL